MSKIKSLVPLALIAPGFPVQDDPGRPTALGASVVTAIADKVRPGVI